MMPDMERTAELSADGLYRYRLDRTWGIGPRMTFLMLNPSTADGQVDDPTIRRCVGFAMREKCTGVQVLNLYAYRATKPTDMWAAADPVGPLNDQRLGDQFAYSAWGAAPVVAAWGAGARAERVWRVRELAAAMDIPLLCLGVTRSGAPRHPLYVRGDQRLIRWEPA